MFGFLKDKLKKAAQLFSRKVEEEGLEGTTFLGFFWVVLQAGWL